MGTYTEHYGGSVDVALTGDQSLELKRAVFVTSTSGAYSLIAQTQDWYRAGGEPQHTIFNGGSHTVTFEDAESTFSHPILVGEAAAIFKTTTGWFARPLGAYGSGSALAANRIPMRFDLAGDLLLDFNLRTHLNATASQWYPQWDGVSPAALECHIHPDLVIGASTTSNYAFTSGDWPTGSTLLLITHAGSVVTGKGGDGGYGGSWPSAGGLLPGNGAPAGNAMYLTVDTNLIHYGRIQGGGGGGGGGSAGNGISGGGGGGGCGHVWSQGGAGGSGGGGAPGLAGSVYIAGGGGIGGSGSGGAGGAPGGVGDPGGAIGGAAGGSIHSLGIVFNKLVMVGLIIGAESHL